MRAINDATPAPASVGGRELTWGVEPSSERSTTTLRRLNYEAAAAHLGIGVATRRSMVCRRQVPLICLAKRLVVFDAMQLDARRVDRSAAARGGAR
jgi:hypothetical protein